MVYYTDPLHPPTLQPPHCMRVITLTIVTVADPFVKQKNMISPCIVQLLAVQDDDSATPSPRRASPGPYVPSTSNVVLHLQKGSFVLKSHFSTLNWIGTIDCLWVVKGTISLYLSKETERLPETSLNQLDSVGCPTASRTQKSAIWITGFTTELELKFWARHRSKLFLSLLAIKAKVETHGEIWVGKHASTSQRFYLWTGIDRACQHPLQPACR